jgi:hypothetical protein
LIFRQTAQNLYPSKCESKPECSDQQAIWRIDDSRSPIAISWSFQRCDEPLCPFQAEVKGSHREKSEQPLNCSGSWAIQARKEFKRSSKTP